MNLHLMRKNLGRKKFRTLFTGLSIVVAFLLFGLLSALGNAFTLGVELAGADRLITIHKVSLIELLPISYWNRVQTVEGVESVTHYTWFGGYFQDPRNQIQSLPTDPDSHREVYSEQSVDEAQWSAWKANRTGMLIGRSLAEQMGWELGDRVPVGSTIWPQQNGSFAWEFTVDAIFDGADEAGTDEQIFYFHYDYFNEARQFGQDLVGWYVMKISDPDNADQVARRIDALFANSPQETKTTTEKGFVQGFAGQIGNIGAIVQFIMAAVFFTMILVAGNTMAQSVRERTGELAVLKTLGFSDRWVLTMILGEAVLLSLAGALIGLLLAWGMVSGMQAQLARFLPGLVIGGGGIALGLGLALTMGVLAGLLPALQAMRLNVVKALARR